MNPGEQLPPQAPIQPVNPPTEPVRDEDKVMLILSYLGLLALIPLITVKDNPTIKWHALNGLVLGLGGGIALSILSAVLGPLACIIGPLGSIALIVVDIMAMVKALNGERWRIPVVTKIAEMF